MSKELVKKEEAALAEMFSGDAGAGFENVDNESLAVPYIGVVKSANAGYVDKLDAKPGQFVDSITLEVYDSLKVIPCAYQRLFKEWTPNRMPVDTHTAVEIETGLVEGIERVHPGLYHRYVDGQKDPNEIQDTRDHYVLYLDKENEWVPAILSLCKTDVKRSKNWMRRMSSLRAGGNPVPSFGCVWEVFSTSEGNDFGKWKGTDVNRLDFVQDRSVYEMAKAFNQKFSGGKVQVVKDGGEF